MNQDERRDETWQAILFPDGKVQIGRLTLGLILAAALCTAWSGFDFKSGFSQNFFITKLVFIQGGVGWNNGLREICAGELWRLWSPFFLHASWYHLLANCFMLMIFGTFVEQRQGSWMLAGMLIVAAPVTDLVQYLVHGPFSVGMSGSVAFLFAYPCLRCITKIAGKVCVDGIISPFKGRLNGIACYSLFAVGFTHFFIVESPAHRLPEVIAESCLNSNGEMKISIQEARNLPFLANRIREIGGAINERKKRGK